MVPLNEPNLCLCGCGGLTSGPKRRFIQGHDAKLAKKWREMRLGRLPQAEIPDEVWELVEAGQLPVIERVELQLQKDREKRLPTKPTTKANTHEPQTEKDIDKIFANLEKRLTK